MGTSVDFDTAVKYFISSSREAAPPDGRNGIKTCTASAPTSVASEQSSLTFMIDGWDTPTRIGQKLIFLRFNRRDSQHRWTGLIQNIIHFGSQGRVVDAAVRTKRRQWRHHEPGKIEGLFQ